MFAKPYGLLLVVGAALAPAAALAQPMAVDDVVKLLNNNISESIIVTRIEETGSYFSLSTDDLIKLKEAGASDELVRYMIVRKPGGPPPEGPGEPGINVTGRVSDEKPATTPRELVELTVSVDGTYVVTSQADLNVWYAAYLDGERIFYKDQWTWVDSFTTAETGARTTKRTLKPGSFTVKVPAGPHTLSLACWSGRQVPTDDVGRANIIYTKKIKAVEGQPLSVNLVGETDTSSDSFVIVH
jgi:hypothetical protein